MERVDAGSSLALRPFFYQLTDAEYGAATSRSTRPSILRNFSSVTMNLMLGAYTFFVFAPSMQARGLRADLVLMAKFGGAYLALFGLVGLFARVSALVRPKEGAPRAGEFVATQDGVSVRMNLRELILPWKKINSVSVQAGLLVICYRGSSAPLIVPRRDIEEFAALWALFDGHLTGVRGLIKNPERTLIVNTAR